MLTRKSLAEDARGGEVGTVALVRDEQRQSVYDAESVAFAGSVFVSSLGMFELSRAARRLAALGAWRAAGGAAIVVHEARADAQRSRAYRSRGEIRIATGQDSIATLAHEAAHLISDDGHGPKFRRGQVEVLRVLAGGEAAARLEWAYSEQSLELAGGEAWAVEKPLCADDLVNMASEGEKDLARSRMFRRVTRLLAKAQSTTEAEATNLRAKAFELAYRHGVEDALEWAGGEDEKIVEWEILLGAGPYVAVRGALVGALSKAYGCQVVGIKVSFGRLMYLSGFESDVARVRSLFFELDVAGRLAMASVATTGNVVAFRRRWLAGYVSGITESLEKVSASTEYEAPGSKAALVLVERGKLVDAYMKSRWKTIRKGAGPKVVVDGAFSAGQVHGRARTFSEQLGAAPKVLGRGKD